MNSQEYWAKREAEALKHYITNEKAYEAEIKQIYEKMLDECTAQINAFYATYASKEGISLAEAKKRVSKADIAAYERKAKRYVKDKDFSAKANEEMRLYNTMMKINRLEMLKANIGLELISGSDELDKFMEGILKGRTEEELQRQAGILGKTIKNNAQKAHAIVNGSFHSGTFSDRIWQYQDLMREELGALLQTGLIQGKNPRALTKDLKKYFTGKDGTGGMRYCMERLMRTELARVQTEAQKQSFIRNGFEEYEFIVNGGCCPVCMALKGKHFKVEKMMPGENAPPMHPHCRCSTAAWSDRKEYDEWLDFLDKGGTTEEWEKLKASKVYKPVTNQNAKNSIITLEDCKDFDEMVNYLSKSYGFTIDDSVKQLDFETVKKAFSGCESIMKEFPGLAKSIKTLTTSKEGVMSCGGDKITFNPHYFKDNKTLLESCKEMIDARFWIPNASPESVAVHEFGHAVEWYMIQKNSAYQYDWQRVDVWNKCTEAKQIVSQACKNIKKTPYGKGKINFELINAISRYSNENASETMAEAFADVYANGENANPLSVEIKQLTIDAVKKYEGGETP